ncbi:hypothetical protein IL306_009965 [Fusarium sp. DS 682]|nr:hypothetical protein IL306_009965 [Fusarium sp. DS 682]
MDINWYWFQRIWRCNSQGKRETYGPTRVLRKKCEPVNPLTRRSNIPSNKTRVKFLYVGISAITCQLVFASRKDDRRTKEYGDDFSGFNFKSEPSQTLAGSNTILSKGCLIANNLSQIKRYLAGITTEFRDGYDAEEKAVRQNQRVFQYLPPKVEHVLPHPAEHLMSKEASDAINTRNAHRLKLIQNANVPLSRLRWDPRDKVLTWDDIQSEVIRAVAEGNLPALRNVKTLDETFDEEDLNKKAPTPEIEDHEFGVTKTEGRTLTAEYAAEMLEVLENLPVTAMDWETLIVALRRNQ